jgi:formylglycine-generating enzyme required for sulfatase activity
LSLPKKDGSGFKPTAQRIKEAKELMSQAEKEVIQAHPDPAHEKTILIPAGEFVMGSTGGGLDEEPERRVFLDGFYIDPYEVTFAQYYAFVTATGHRKPRLAGYLALEAGELYLLMKPSNPVVGVSWHDARDYCDWKGKRLPTEAEWEKAARGTDGRKWPWGDKEEPAYANLVGPEDGFRYLSPVGAFGRDMSPYGVYDMAGNAMEWTADWYQEDYYRTAPARNPKGPETGEFSVGPDRKGFKVIRGTSWNDSVQRGRTAVRFKAFPEYRDVTIGFRCAGAA